MVVEESGEYCDEETRNFKIDSGIRVHVADIIDIE